MIYDEEKKRKSNYLYSALLLFVMLIYLFTPFSFTLTTNADSVYSYVLDDLQKDENFDVADYPVVEDDYSLQVIQIAETTDKELLVYVYQPSQCLTATRVSMSVNQGETYILYNLTLLNSAGVFFKYKLSTFTVLDEEVRYYNISSIYRIWDEDIDGKTNTENEKAFEVGQTMKAVGFGESTTFEYENVKVVEVSSKIVANVVSFKDDFFSWMNPTDSGYCSHIIAFSTDLPIDQIFEAEVYAEYHYETYVINSYGVGALPNDRIDSSYPKYVSLNYDDIASVSKKGKTYTFNRIMRTADYLKALGEDEVIFDNDFKSLDWVLCVSEATDFFLYTYTGIGFGYTEVGGTLIDLGSILKLKFDMGGITYDLGVVDNISDSKGYVKGESWLDWLKNNVLSFIFICLAIIVVIVFVVSLFFSKTRDFLLKVGELVCKGLWWILTLPYQLFKDK